MSAPPTVLSQTLQSITITKIRQLKKQRANFETQKSKWLQNASNAGHDQRERIRRLLLTIKEFDPSAASTEPLSNINRWFEQSEFDLSIPDEMLDSFEGQLRDKFNIHSRRLGLADLYSSLLTEWLKSSASRKGESGVQETTSLDDSFEIVEKDRLQQLRAKFEAVVFEPLETDEIEIDLYLAGLFSADENPRAIKGDRTVALDRIRTDVRSHGERILECKTPFNQQFLTWTIKGLLRNDLLSDEKKVVLRDFLHDEVALGEIRDVLNMKYADLENWSWDADQDGMPYEPRSQLNGKYRIMMDEDVLQAIFLDFIGVEWCVSMKKILSDAMRYTSIWKGPSNPTPSQNVAEKRQFYLGLHASQQEAEGGVNKAAQRTYRDEFFLSRLPSFISQGAGGYDDDEVNEDEDGVRDANSKSAKLIKQQLLRQLATEVHVRRALDGEVAVVQSDMQWFAAGLPHSTITAVLRFLGLPEPWIVFFKKFLEAPLNMGPVGDSENSQVRIRRRGVPIAHALETFFGEIVLFGMDLAVNQEAGMYLYRLHDDLWLCGKPTDCAKAWKSMERFANIMGLEFNKRKTGSVYLIDNGKAADSKVVNILPVGPVSVGFLTLDANTGTWVIDQIQVDAHIKQLQKQLRACNSILSWVQTWNSCIGRFFNHTFGEPANCFGKPHVNNVLETHQRMQRFLFNGVNGTGNNVTTHLKYLIKERFGVTDIPDAFIFLPEHLGGLGATNPFVPLFLVRNQLYDDPAARMQTFFEAEKKQYEDYKDKFECLDELRLRKRFVSIYEKYGEHDKEYARRDESFNSFMSFEEYVMYRESTSKLLHDAYNDLMKTPEKDDINMSPLVLDAIGKMGDGPPEMILENFNAEQKWALQLYSAELFEKCGGLSMVDKTLLPLGVLTILRKRKVTWQMVL